MFSILQNEGRSSIENEECKSVAIDWEKDRKNVAYLLGKILGRLKLLDDIDITIGAEIQMWERVDTKLSQVESHFKYLSMENICSMKVYFPRKV